MKKGPHFKIKVYIFIFSLFYVTNRHPNWHNSRFRNVLQLKIFITLSIMVARLVFSSKYHIVFFLFHT